MKQYFATMLIAAGAALFNIVAPLVAQAQGGVPIVSALPAASYALAHTGMPR